MNSSKLTVYVLFIYSLLATTVSEEHLSIDDDESQVKTDVTPKWLSQYWLIASSLLALQGSALYYFGQPIWSRTGGIRFWCGDINDRENSQHFTDWYTFSHILHGVGFYWILSKVVPHYSIPLRSLLSIVLEVVWEVAENTPMVINRYRQTALANGYTGDSIINSVSDTVAMTVGFYLSDTLPGAVMITFAVAIELLCAYKVRDNLTLNVIQLIHPFESISRWQTNKD